MQIEVTVPKISTVIVTGPTQTGKSIVMAKLKQVLEEEFGASVVLNDNLKKEERMTCKSDLEDWEKKLVQNTVWFLNE